MRDRIRSRGVPVFGPLDHGLCHSIYFAGPENLTLEVATSDQVEHPLDNHGMWIDPEVVELAGISSEELQQYVQPASYVGQGGSVEQPEFDPEKPHLAYPKEAYPMMMKMADRDFNTRPEDRVPPSLSADA